MNKSEDEKNIAYEQRKREKERKNNLNFNNK